VRLIDALAVKLAWTHSVHISRVVILHYHALVTIALSSVQIADSGNLAADLR
jgi:hypothetical protein